MVSPEPPDGETPALGTIDPLTAQVMAAIYAIGQRDRAEEEFKAHSPAAFAAAIFLADEIQLVPALRQQLVPLIAQGFTLGLLVGKALVQ